MRFPSECHHVTSFFPKGCDYDLFFCHHVTSIFPKGFSRHLRFSLFCHQLSPLLSPVYLGLNLLISQCKRHGVTMSPVCATYLLYITHKKEGSIYFLAHSMTLLEKTGDTGDTLLNPSKWLDKSCHQLLVTTGDTGDTHHKANIGPNSDIGRCWQ